MRSSVVAGAAMLLILPGLVIAAVCPALSRNLSRGMSGDDMKQLQQFLIAQSDLGAGYDTGFFGALTEAAVQKFQCDQNIVCDGSPSATGWGSVGPKTRAAIANICAGTTSVPPPISNTNNPPPISNSNFLPLPQSSGGSGSCEWSGISVASGQTVTAYRNFSVPFNSTCVSEERTCRSGALSGSYPYSWCVSDGAPSCSLDGTFVLDGQYQTFYSSRTVPQTLTCSDVALMRQCMNGTLTGSNDFHFSSCSVSTATSSLPVAPTGLNVSCNGAGDRVTLLWDAMPGAATYGIRLIRNATTTFTRIIDWYVGTSYTTDIFPDTYYSWWVHANPDASTLGPYSAGALFKCAASSTSS